VGECGGRAGRRGHLVAAGHRPHRARLRRPRRQPGRCFPGPDLADPVRLGDASAQHVISWQVGAAAAGGAGLSAAIGLLIGATSLAALGPAITALAVLLVGAELILTRLAPIRTRP